ncbi:MAG: spermidine synthase [Spirochaetaceae bacterium]|nr:spermidine synthase [Spirochaetaceae bacterium]|tara:strand:- start:13494 stop:14447 length:954 start_codon:yes stop_codon:yes gene_type:complete
MAQGHSEKALLEGGATGNIYFETVQSGLLAGFTFQEILFEKSTEFQQATLVQTEAFGKTLFLDGILNSAESDEFIYHEALVHPAMIRSRSRKRVLIVGGAEGGVLREVFRYQDVEQCVMVDIDGELVQLCQDHLADVYGNPWKDPRLKLLHQDGRSYLEESEPFDVIILDLNEATEEGPARLLFTREFYALIRKKLNPGGMVSMQSEWINTGFHFDLCKTQKASLGQIVVLEVSVPSFLLPEALNLASQEGTVPNPSPEQIDKELENLDISTRFYNGSMDLKLRTLSPSQMEGYKKPARIFSDNEPPVFEDSEVQSG